MGIDRSRLPGPGPTPVFRFPAIVRHRLANGLDVRTLEHSGLPLVTLVMVIDGGLGADPAGRNGLAALTADMVDEGTGALSTIEVADAMTRLGAEYDVEVAGDGTFFTLTTLTRFADRGAALLADLLLRPSLRESDFTRVRQLRLDRARQMTDQPSAVAEKVFLSLLYADHPYGHLPIGDAPSLHQMELPDVERFHAATFQPSRATLVVAGSLGHQALLAVAERAFGGWSPSGADGPPARAADLDPPAHPTARLTVVPRDGAPQSELRIGHLSARRNTPDHAALMVMNALLGGQFVSRINLKLREEKGYTYGARTSFDWHRGLSPFSLQVSVHTAATADAIADALREISDIRGARPPSGEEMALAGASLTRGYPRNFETVQQVARAVGQLALFDLPDAYFEQFVPRIEAVTPAEVTRVAERYLDPARLATLIVGDHAAIRDSLPALGLGEAHLRSAQG